MEKKKYNAAVILRCLISSLVWGGVLALNASMLSVSSGIAAAFAGGAAGFLCGEKLASSKIKTYVFIIGGLILDRILEYIGQIPVNSAFIAEMLSPETAVYTSQFFIWLVNSFILVCVLHAISIRKPWFIAVELIIVANIALLPLAGHRNGYISRPYSFVDPLWSKGYSPIPFFVGAGSVLSAAIVLLILGRGNKRSTAFDFALLSLLILLIGIFIPIKEFRQPLPEQILGGIGEASGEEQKDGKEDKGSAEKDGSKDKDKDNQDKDNQNQDKDQDKNQDKNPDKNNSNQNKSDQNNSNNNSNSDSDSDGNQNDKAPEDSPAAVVIFEDDYNPPEGYFYFRKDVHSFFNGLKLVANTDGKYDHDTASGYPTEKGENPLTPPTVDYSLTKYVNTKVALIEPHDIPFGLINPVRMEAAGNPNTSQFLSAYKVRSACHTGKLENILNLKLNNPSWSSADIAYYTDLPKDPRYKKLADKICSEIPGKYASNPTAKVIALKLWLDKNCTYDSKARITDPNDVVAKFLFGDKVGYCTHLANSMAYLCRAEGIPARVANGYAVDAKNTYGGSSLLIMQTASHAWCEIYLQGLGWYPIDISPEKVNNAENQNPPDADLQKMLGEMAREETSDAEGNPTQPKDTQQDLQFITKILGYMLAAAAVLAVIGCWFYKIYIHIMAYFGEGKVRANRVCRAALTSLAEAGIYRKYGETREEFADRLKEDIPSLREITENHVRTDLGFGEQFSTYLPVPDAAESAQKYAELKKSLAKKVSWKRRLLGIINPFSWIFVK